VDRARLARLRASATEALGDSEKGSRWLRRPNRTLGGKTPLETARTEAGLRLVEEALGRVMYGSPV